MQTSKVSLQSAFNNVYNVSEAARSIYLFDQDKRLMCNKKLNIKVDILIRNRVYLETADCSIFSFSEMIDQIDGDIFYDRE